MKKLIPLILALFLSYASYAQLARVQVIHNSADLSIAVVDVYINGTLAVGDAAFRTASPFSDVPAGIPLSVAIAPGDSTGAGDAFHTENITFESGETYVIIAAGIVSLTGYDPAPAFSLETFDMGREAAADPTMIDILIHHGSTDAPVFDVFETAQGLGQVVDNFGFTDYDGYFEYPAADYVIELRDETGTTPLAAYVAPLDALGLEGVAVTVVASGFWDPTQNSNGPAFGLYAASPLGGNMLALPPSPLGIDDVNSDQLKVYPNPASEELQLAGIELSGFDFQITDITGRVVQTGALVQNENTLDISSLSEGMYQLTLINSNKLEGTVKFLKN